MASVRKATVDVKVIAAARPFEAYPLPHFHSILITQPFGTNYASFYAQLGMDGHNGLDIRAATGTKAYAVISGTIDAVQSVVANPAAGTTLALVSDPFRVRGLDRDIRLRCLYFHLLDWTLGAGTRVKAGEFICRTDNTGYYTTGAHLHFGLKIEVKNARGEWETLDWDNGFHGAVDPEPFWPRPAEVQYQPVDTRYGRPQMALVEYVWLLYWGPVFRRKFGREISPREMNGAVYGRWPFEDLIGGAGEWKQRPRN